MLQHHGSSGLLHPPRALDVSSSCVRLAPCSSDSGAFNGATALYAPLEPRKPPLAEPPQPPSNSLSSSGAFVTQGASVTSADRHPPAAAVEGATSRQGSVVLTRAGSLHNTASSSSLAQRRRGTRGAPAPSPPDPFVTVEDEASAPRPWNAQFQAISELPDPEQRRVEADALISEFEREVRAVAAAIVDDWCSVTLPLPPSVGAAGGMLRHSASASHASGFGRRAAVEEERDAAAGATPRWLPAPPEPALATASRSVPTAASLSLLPNRGRHAASRHRSGHALTRQPGPSTSEAAGAPSHSLVAPPQRPQPLRGTENKFHHRGVHYTVVATAAHEQYYGSLENAHKAAAEEVRVLRQLWNENPAAGAGSDTTSGGVLGDARLSFPLVALCSVSGFSVFACAAMPIDEECVIGGFHPRGDDRFVIVTDRTAHALLEQLANYYSFCPFFVCDEHRDSVQLRQFEQLLPLDAKLCRSSEDGRLYAFGLAAYFPPLDLAITSLLHSVSSGSMGKSGGSTASGAEDVAERDGAVGTWDVARCGRGARQDSVASSSSPASPLVLLGETVAAALPSAPRRNAPRCRGDDAGSGTTRPTGETREKRTSEDAVSPLTETLSRSKFAQRVQRGHHYWRFPWRALALLAPELRPSATALTSVGTSADSAKLREAMGAVVEYQLRELLRQVSRLDLDADAARVPSGSLESAPVFDGVAVKRLLHGLGLRLRHLGLVHHALASPPADEDRGSDDGAKFAAPTPRNPRTALTPQRPAVVVVVPPPPPPPGDPPEALAGRGATAGPHLVTPPRQVMTQPQPLSCTHLAASAPVPGLGDGPSPSAASGGTSGSGRSASVWTTAGYAGSPPRNATDRTARRRFSTATGASMLTPRAVQRDMEPEIWITTDTRTAVTEALRIEAIARAVRALIREHVKAAYSVRPDHPDPTAIECAAVVPTASGLPQPTRSAQRHGARSALLDHLRSLAHGTSEPGGDASPKRMRSTLSMRDLSPSRSQLQLASTSPAARLMSQLHVLEASVDEQRLLQERRLNAGRTSRSLDLSTALGRAVETAYERDPAPLFNRSTVEKHKADEARECVALILGLTFGASPAAEHFWATTIMAEIWSRYGTLCSMIELRRVDFNALLRRICELAALEVEWPTGKDGCRVPVQLGTTFSVSAVRGIAATCKSLIDLDGRPRYTPVLIPMRQPPEPIDALGRRRLDELLNELRELEATHYTSLADLQEPALHAFISVLAKLVQHLCYLGREHADGLAVFRMRLRQMRQQLEFCELRELWKASRLDGVVYAPCPSCGVFTNLSQSPTNHRCHVVPRYAPLDDAPRMPARQKVGSNRKTDSGSSTAEAASHEVRLPLLAEALAFAAAHPSPAPMPGECSRDRGGGEEGAVEHTCIDRGLFPIGLGDGRFPDSRVTASSSQRGFAPHLARLGLAASGWAPEDAVATDGRQYLQIRFLAQRTVAALHIAGSPREGRSLEYFSLLYSDDGAVWRPYTGAYHHFDQALHRRSVERIRDVAAERERRRARDAALSEVEIARRLRSEGGADGDESPLPDEETLRYGPSLVTQKPRRQRAPEDAASLRAQLAARHPTTPRDSSQDHHHSGHSHHQQQPSSPVSLSLSVSRGPHASPTHSSDAAAPVKEAEVDYAAFVPFGVLRGCAGGGDDTARLTLATPFKARFIRIVPGGHALTNRVGFRLEVLCVDAPVSEEGDLRARNAPETERIPPPFVNWARPVTQHRVSRNRSRLELAQHELRLLRELHATSAQVFAREGDKLLKLSSTFLPEALELVRLLREWGTERQGDVPVAVTLAIRYAALEVRFVHAHGRPTAAAVEVLIKLMSDGLKLFRRSLSGDVELLLRLAHGVLREAGGQEALLRPLVLSELRVLGARSVAVPFLVELLGATSSTPAEIDEALEACNALYSPQLAQVLHAAARTATTALAEQQQQQQRRESDAARSCSGTVSTPSRSVGALQQLVRLEKLHGRLRAALRGDAVVELQSSPRDDFYGIAFSSGASS